MSDIADELLKVLQEHREKNAIGAQPPVWEPEKDSPEPLTEDPKPGTIQE